MNEQLMTQELAELKSLLRQVVAERSAKSWYTTAEVSAIVGRKEYTVREWCRKSQIPAEKALNGRGWLISHETLTRIMNRELPLPEHQAHRVLHG